MKDWLISHRGAQKSARENTLLAFKEALNHPVGGIELDAHVTIDGVVVCNHDPLVKGTPIQLTTYAQLKNIEPELITFSEVVDIIDNQRLLIVDVKSLGTAKEAIKILHHHENWLMTTRDPKVGEELFNLVTDKKQLIFILKYFDFWQLKRIKRLGLGGFSVNQRVMTPRLYRFAVFNDLQAYTYTVNSPAQAKLFRMLYPKLKIFSDRPDRLQSIK
ncbi:glycerophosphodiester phosphodiesterase [Candidatus Saccharibacteria bacterium]|jgi:glycerophosphoryl diester phosphodiesterase|nr:glycerophosphodiester phosphodiesterase [Candidatus Saccharibacteria bacterium]